MVPAMILEIPLILYITLGVAIIANPIAINTSCYYFRVRKRLMKTKGRGSVEYLQKKYDGCAERGARMAAADYKKA